MARANVHKDRSRKSKRKEDSTKRWFYNRCDVRSYQKLNDWLAQNTIKVVPTADDIID